MITTTAAAITPPALTLADPAVRASATGFLSRVVPWPINGIGYVNLHYSIDNPRGGKPIVTGKPYHNIDDLLGFCNWAQGNNNNIKELWYCTSLQSQATTNSRGGLKAVRLKSNAIYLKAIWVDIDVDNTQKNPGKHYNTQAEAWAAKQDWERAWKAREKFDAGK